MPRLTLMPICKYLSVSISAKRQRQTTDLFLKKSGSVLRKNAQVKFAMNKHNENDLAEGRCAYYYRFHALATIAGEVSKSLTKTKQTNQIKQVFDEEKGRSGSPRIAKQLHYKLGYVSPETFETKKSLS